MVRENKQKSMKVKETLSERIFSVFNYVLLTLIALIMLYPLVNVIAISFSTYTDYIVHQAALLVPDFRKLLLRGHR